MKKKEIEEAKQAQLEVRLAKKWQKEKKQQLKALNSRLWQRYNKTAQPELPGAG